ncbi:N-acetylmuramoyl-L-alanine amidase [Pseudoxanthomonas mexicana]|uniref:N-acetylmuramoyl-L-alanine amidase n=1 Tax=Pseudoxanthomonas mexicana TaxID=128785 RepID=UPI00398AAB45
MRPGKPRSIPESLRWLGGLLSLFLAVPVLAGEVDAIDLASTATGTRAEIRLQGAGEFKTLSLKGPDRLVVDLPASSARRGLRLPAGAGIVSAVRTGQPTPGTLRVVFDLSADTVPLKPRVETVGNTSRLVIEWPGDGPGEAVAAQPASSSSTSPIDSAIHPPAGPTAAQATAALATQVSRAATIAPATPVPAPPSSGLSPQAILEGHPTDMAVASPAASGPAIAAGQAVPPSSDKPEAVATAPAREADALPPPARPALAMQPGMRPLVIAIDPGHGGQDPGAVGPGGTYEKNVVLAIARELARQINATPGMRAYLTRDSDVFIPLPVRAQKARAAKADMFVSIHADAAENRNARGSSVYVLSLKGASSQRARWLADKENASDLIGGVALQKVDNTLSSVLLDLAQSGHMKASEDAASHVLDGLKRIGNNHKPHIERANFAVLRTSDMPSMLVETAFISNVDEERRLKDPAYQRKVAAAVLDGVNTYFTRQPPPGTLFAAIAQQQQQARENAGAGAGAP